MNNSMENNLQDVLKKANAEVEKAGITDPEFKKIAFSKAVDFYLHGSDASSRVNIQETIKGTQKTFDDFWELLGSATGIEIGKLKDIYSIKDGQVLLVVSSVPGNSKSDRQRNLAALILFAYHEGLRNEWVTANFLAKAADHSKLYDTSNFAKNLRSKETNWFSMHGVKKGLTYKLSGPGISHTKDLLVTLTQ